jgi:hypothetical protein
LSSKALARISRFLPTGKNLVEHFLIIGKLVADLRIIDVELQTLGKPGRVKAAAAGWLSVAIERRIHGDP